MQLFLRITQRHSLTLLMCRKMMSDFNNKFWQIKEFANISGVTVRTLHYYDKIGLLKPQYYNRKGFRTYGESEFTRLQQISTLKFVGFSLKQIKEILDKNELDLAATLRFQRKLVEKQRDKLNLSLEAMISLAEKNVKDGGENDWESFNKIIEVINMKQNMDWTKKYYSETAPGKIEELKKIWSPELQDRVSNDWRQLYSEIKTAIAESVKPSDEKAQNFVRRWNALINEFTNGDAEIRDGLNKMYSDEKNWQTNWNEDFDDKVRTFISEAAN